MKQLTLEQKLFLNGFRPDRESHLRIIDQGKCRQCKLRQCTYVCPVNTYRWENDQQGGVGDAAASAGSTGSASARPEAGRLTVFFEGCLECGACRIACADCGNLEWRYPRGGFGINYRTG